MHGAPNQLDTGSCGHRPHIVDSCLVVNDARILDTAVTRNFSRVHRPAQRSPDRFDRARIEQRANRPIETPRAITAILDRSDDTAPGPGHSGKFSQVTDRVGQLLENTDAEHEVNAVAGGVDGIAVGNRKLMRREEALALIDHLLGDVDAKVANMRGIEELRVVSRAASDVESRRDLQGCDHLLDRSISHRIDMVRHAPMPAACVGVEGRSKDVFVLFVVRTHLYNGFEKAVAGSSKYAWHRSQ